MRSLSSVTTRLIVILGMCFLASCSSMAGTSATVHGKPVYGGTLRVISSNGPGPLDPVPIYNYAGYELERGYARQLVTYPTVSPGTASGAAWLEATSVVPDVAMTVPSAANGGITDHGLTYTYHLRRGAGYRRRLHPRIQGVLQSGAAPCRQPGLFHVHHHGIRQLLQRGK
jgi:ABC-type transport system substrate-binding protein